MLDEYPVDAEYVMIESLDATKYDEQGVLKHCRISQYMLPIVKCNDSDCCANPRSAWKSIIPSRFLPAPTPVNIDDELSIPSKQKAKKTDKYTNLWQRLAADRPYDWV